MKESPDSCYLRAFREDETAYQTLLEAVHEVIAERGILMPCLPADVFMRHPYLGGRPKLSSTWVEEEEHMSNQEIIQILSAERGMTPKQRFLERYLKGFFLYAITRKDLISEDLPMIAGGHMQGYTLSANALWENPPVGELVFYEKKRKYR